MARMREKAARAPRTTTSFPSHTTSTTLSSSKRDKRLIKHSLLLSRVKKNSSAKKPLRRNRKAKPAQQGDLSANLSSLIDALPGTEATAEAGGKGSVAANVSQVKVALAGGRSIASRPGLQKRREAVSKLERERFARNLAAMSAKKKEEVVVSQGENQGLSASKYAVAGKDESGNRADRWAALRNHIQQSMASQTNG